MLNFLLIACLLVTVLSAIPVIIQLRRQPKGLIVCFLAEMWERFSFYGMRALLIYYLTQHFLFDDNRASDQYGSYTALVYMTPLIGGMLADRWLGTRKAILFGAALLCLGHLGMAIEGRPAQQFLDYDGHSYSLQLTGRQEARKARLEIDGHAYDWTATKDGGLAITGLPADAPLPQTLPKDSFKFRAVTATPWAEQAYYFAVSLIILGVGLLKPNISTLVGQLYPAGDKRRDSGFQLYYYGINVGSFWSALLCGWVGQSVGWWAGFGLAGIGMAIGFVAFTLGKPWLDGRGNPPADARLDERVLGPLSRKTLIGALTLLIGLPAIYLLIQHHGVVGVAELIAVTAILAFVAFRMITRYSRAENLRLLLAMTLSLCSVVFWTLFEQTGSSLNLFAARNVDLQFLSHPESAILLGKTVVFASQTQLAAMGGLPDGAVWVDMGIAASQTQGFNAGFILLFAPALAALFAWLGHIRRDPPPLFKFAFALLCVGASFLFLSFGANFIDSAFRVPWYFLMLTYMLHSLGELTLSPVGLSQQTKLSPVTLVSTMMAIWFLGTSGAQYLAALVARLAATDTVGGQVLDPAAALKTSVATFTTIGWWGIGLAAVVFGLAFLISHWGKEPEGEVQ